MPFGRTRTRARASHIAALGFVFLVGIASPLAVQAEGRADAVSAWSKLSKKKKKKRAKKAKRYEKKAKKATKKAKWDDAIAAFELAYKNKPEPRYLFNIGRCYEQKGDLFKAMDYTRRYVALTPVGDEREDAEEMADMLRERLKKSSGEILVKSAPMGATAKLRGETRTVTGKTPLKRWLEAGTWKLEVTHPEFPAKSKEISVALGEVTEVLVDLRLEETKKPKPAKQVEPAAAAPTEDKAVVDEEEKQPAAEASKVTASDETESGSLLPLVAVVAGTALLAGGGGYALTYSDAIERRDAFKTKLGSLEEIKAAHDEADAAGKMATVLLALGGTAVVAGGVLWALEPAPEATPEAGAAGDVSILFAPLPSGGALTIRRSLP